MRRRLLLLSTILLSADIFCPAVRAELRGGCARTNITPPVGVWLSGYGSRDRPSDDIVDELWAKAVVLSDGHNTVAIVATDLLWVPLQITKKIRGIVKEKTGIPEDHVLISATHTHFGPKIFAKTKIGPDVPGNTVDEAYVQTLIRKIADSVFLAHRNMKDVRIGAAKGEIPEIVHNRRPRNSDGSVTMAFSLSPEALATRKIVSDPDGSVRVTFTHPPEGPAMTFGPVDPEAWVLRIEDTDGEVVACIVNFACHAVSGSAYPDWFYSISADFPGETMRVVEQAEGGICLFTAGTTGDIVPIKRGRWPRLQIGRALAGEVLKRLQFVRTSNEVATSAMRKQVKLPVKPDPSPDRITDAGTEDKHLTTEIQVIRLGDVYILGLPGEVLVEVGLQIKKRAGLQNLLIVSLSNDAIGYVCHSEAYDEGGYEPGTGTNLAKGAAEILIEQALALIDEMRADTAARKTP
ncbi:MAG: neutral/alkaline non-lysosomal ceramidase N-terminal domain-containing protein [Phycisphaerales bacterium]|nr:MAG: neutral/alkaline non-lysosomal ceramidase N-terminal domain-containing protein [Phycisphaerales bacterium]